MSHVSTFLGRAGILGSTPFDFSRNPTLFVRLLLGLTQSSPRFLGFDETIRVVNGVRLVTVDDVEYRLLRCVFNSGAIRGRGTVCWSAVRADDQTGTKYVIKDAWTLDTSRRHAEEDLLRRLHSIDGIPVLVGHTTVANGLDLHHCTKTVRQLLQGRDLSAVEDRVHKRIVTTPLARDLADFNTKRELLHVLIDAVGIHRDMCAEKVLHRDVSAGNIMINTAAESSRKALLIDLDYAIVTETLDNTEAGDGDLTASKGYRTGTFPFMAVDILWGKPHEPCHDLESFIYVLVWICICYAGPNNTPRKGFTFKNKELDVWAGNSPSSLTFSNIGNIKVATFCCTGIFESQVLAHIHPYFDSLKPCLYDLQSLIQKQTLRRIPPITHEMIETVLKKHMDQLPETEDNPAVAQRGVKRTHQHCSDDGLVQASLSGSRPTKAPSSPPAISASRRPAPPPTAAAAASGRPHRAAKAPRAS
ncbi:hypothetical protein D9619_013202 [Psilocybe cf. subviscida]|uniref:Protein kinase domain-containing protein n=1 Tax=Psilocybe cf. subviscida TaxID=2480587 RepID=A0A8H5EYZ9_9AGAR|nr:hypothetical protein D9619_013202 [Psilocybe cf. subviscida]